MATPWGERASVSAKALWDEGAADAALPRDNYVSQIFFPVFPLNLTRISLEIA